MQKNVGDRRLGGGIDRWREIEAIVSEVRGTVARVFWEHTLLSLAMFMRHTCVQCDFMSHTGLDASTKC